MKQFVDKILQKYGLVIELLLLFYVAITSIVWGESKATWYLVTNAIASAFIAYIPFYLGLLAHGKQNVSINHIEQMVSQQQTKLIEQVDWITEEKFNPYVQIALYAMYQVSCNQPFNYRIIDPQIEATNIYRTIILTLIITLKTDYCIGYIDKDEYLNVEFFDNEAIKAIPDGQKLISMFSDTDSGRMVQECVKRIDAACGISQRLIQE